MRTAYKGNGNKIQFLPLDRIERLEEIGFQWKGIDYDEAFEKHCRELIAFKDEECGHYNTDNRTLERWCGDMMKIIQENSKGNESRCQSLTRRNRATGGDWLPITGLVN